jgi:hypothetical protein
LAARAEADTLSVDDAGGTGRIEARPVTKGKPEARMLATYEGRLNGI